MLAIVCNKPGEVVAEERQKPVRADDEVLVRIRRIGVCGTDLHIFTGNQPYLSYPRIMGHELSGTVEDAPQTSDLAPGDIVTIIPYISCGRCSACLKGKSNCCRNIGVLGVHRDGGMMEYLSVPRNFVLKAEGLTLDQAAMTEFLAIGAHAVRRGAVEAGMHVLVVGAGPIGMAVGLFAALNGGRVTMIDSREDRLSFCRDHLGVSNTVQLGDDDKARLSDLTGGDFFDVVFDATGNPKAMERGFSLVGHGGAYVLVSIVQGVIAFDDPEFHKREMTLISSRNATREDFEHVLSAQRAGKVPDALITHRMMLTDVPAEFSNLTKPAAGVIKGMVEVS